MFDSLTPFANAGMAALIEAGESGILADRRGCAGRASGRSTVDPALRSAFLHSKMHIAHTHPTRNLPRRNKALFEFARRLGSVPAGLIHQPCPAGIGYGVFYKPEYGSQFRIGTELLWRPLCPPSAGGNLGKLLYVTATNRSAYGAEALLCYDGSNTVSLHIHDWARMSADRWQVSMTLAGLQPYLASEIHQGQHYSVLPIWNSTVRLAPGAWRNSVFLFDRHAGSWALIYQHDYARRDDRQRGKWVGSWGPSLETFQALHAGTNPFGALGTKLRGCNIDGAWSQWSDLTAEMSELRCDNGGFQPVMLEENHDWIVTS